MTILLFLFLLYNNKNLVPKIWGWLWILNKLVSIGHMYSSFPYSILSKVLFSVTSLIYIYIYIYIYFHNYYKSKKLECQEEIIRKSY